MNRAIVSTRHRVILFVLVLLATAACAQTKPAKTKSAKPAAQSNAGSATVTTTAPF